MDLQKIQNKLNTLLQGTERKLSFGTMTMQRMQKIYRRSVKVDQAK